MIPLVRTPSPYATESLWGYILRVSEANGYNTPWHVLSHADLGEQTFKVSVVCYEKLAKVLGKAASELAPLSYHTDGADGTRHFCILGQSLGKSLTYSPFEKGKPTLCPHCVMENGYLDASWDLSLFVACPKHRCALIKKCSACGEALSWFRPGLLTCKCGASLVDVPTQTVDQPLIDLMSVLQARIRGMPLSRESNLTGLPLQYLANLSLRSLIVMLSAFGNFNLSSHGREATNDILGVAEGAAEVLVNWPYGYYDFLRRIGAKTNQQEAAGLGLRKQFNKFYSCMFTKRTYRHEMEFLHEEFIRFGLEEWGESVVHEKMRRGVTGKSRFVSAHHLANMVGIRPITLRRWAESGKIVLKEVAFATQRRLIADLKENAIPKKTAGKKFGTRAAAAQIGLPVRALKALKESGHFAVTHMPMQLPGYHEHDLGSFREKLLSCSQPIENVDVYASTIALGDVMQHLQFWTEAGKADFLVAYLKGEIQSIGRVGESIQQIYFRTSDVQQYLSTSREVASDGAISQWEACQLIGCDEQAIPGLIKAGHLKALSGPERTRVVRESAIDFSANYVCLTKLAKDGDTSSRRLARLAVEISIPMLSFFRKVGGPIRFIRLQDLEKLMTHSRNSPARKSAPNFEMSPNQRTLRGESEYSESKPRYALPK
jgi:hypothetical protein